LKHFIHRYRTWLLSLTLTLTLAACVAPMLLLSPQGQLMWALLKPLVGLDPKTTNLFEQPLLKGRLQALLGDNYSTAVSLLNTADKIQQEGPLFYLVSNYTPVPQLAEKAGFVWNAETNQMAVLLVSGGAPLIFAEQLNQQASKVIPSWPAELVDYTDPVKLKKMAMNSAAASASTTLGLSEQQTALATTAVTGGDVKKLAIDQATDKATASTTKALGLSEQQAALVKTAATGGDVKKQAVDQATKTATEAAKTKATELGLSEQQAELVKTATTGGDVKKLALSQATTAASETVTTTAISELGLSEQQAALIKTATTGGDVKKLAVGQATKAATEVATETVTDLATTTATEELGLSEHQSQLMQQAAKGASTEQLAAQLEQQKIAALQAELTLATEQEMAAEMALEQAEDKLAAAELQLAQATTGALKDTANATLVSAQTNQQAASKALLQVQQKVQLLQQQLKLPAPPTAKPTQDK
jgi:hypothetical protein